MSYQSLLYNVSDGVATVTLNRSEKFNAFTTAMIAEAIGAFRQAEKDASVRAIILTGAGKAFCSGQDLNEFASIDPSTTADHLREGYNVLVTAMRTIEKPIVGAINWVAS